MCSSGTANGADRFELNPVSLRKQFLVLRENQRKIDVWHALLSFQGTAPPGSRPEAAPDRRREVRKNIRLAADLPAYAILAGLVNPWRGAAARKDATAHAGGGPWKDPTLAGNGNIGPP